jgi:excisionase family DNA binding protein
MMGILGTPRHGKTYLALKILIQQKTALTSKDIYISFRLMRLAEPNKKPQKAPELELLTVPEAAAFLTVSGDFVRDEIRKRHLAHHRLGWRIFVSRADLEGYLKRQRTAALGELRTTVK